MLNPHVSYGPHQRCPVLPDHFLANNMGSAVGSLATSSTNWTKFWPGRGPLKAGVATVGSNGMLVGG